jgi:hypothetical protein
MRKLLKLIAIFMLVTFGQSAQAALTSAVPPSCSFSDVIAAPSFAMADGCSGAWDAAPSPSQSDLFAELSSLGLANPFLLGKSDDPGSGPFTSSSGGTNGTLFLDDLLSGPFAVGLHAGGNFSLYFFDGGNTNVSALFFDTKGVSLNSHSSPQGLSHANLYISAIPEPEIYAMMTLGLGLLGFLGRRRRQLAVAA